jgi:hypothetical protein
MFHVPYRRRALPWLALIYGVIALLWLSREDNDVVWVVMLGGALSLLLVAFAVTGHLGGRRMTAFSLLVGSVLLGLLAGLGTAVAAILLMLFKNAWHAHLFLDYPPPLMLGILERAPAWALAGGFAGLGLALALLARLESRNALED